MGSDPTEALRQRPPTSTTTQGRYEKLYVMLLDAIPSSVLLVDRQSRIVSANRNFLEKARRQRSDTIGQPIAAVFPPLVVEHMDLARRIREAFESNRPTHGERITYRAPGLGSRVYYYSLIPFSWEGAIEHVMLLLDDVTEQVRLGEEARRAERHLASVVESANDIVLSTTVDGAILTWNTAAERISGYTFSEVEQDSFFGLCDPKDRTRAKRAFQRARAGKTFGAVVEWDLLTRSGALVPVSWVGSAMRDDAGDVVAIVAVGRDLSERRKLEAQLLKSQKLAALGVLAGGIAHEIRNPLAVSSSAAQFLFEGDDDAEFRKECAMKIIEGIGRASRIIEDLLRFARPGVGVNVVPLDLLPIVAEAVTLVSPQGAVQRVQFEVHLPDRAVWISGVASLLQQVFVNLLLNALTAMPDGGLLRVTMDQEGDEARVRVADTGHGMGVEELDRIFDPFYTTMPVGKGTGLGLSVSYAIVRQHFGFIEVESAVGGGSTFSVRLPLLPSEEDDADTPR